MTKEDGLQDSLACLECGKCIECGATGCWLYPTFECPLKKDDPSDPKSNFDVDRPKLQEIGTNLDMPIITGSIDYLVANHIAANPDKEYRKAFEEVMTTYVKSKFIPIIVTGGEQYIVPSICGPTGYMGTCESVIVKDVVASEGNFKSFDIEKIDVIPMGDKLCDQIKIHVKHDDVTNQLN